MGPRESGKSSFIRQVYNKSSLYKQNKIKPRMLLVNLSQRSSKDEFQHTIRKNLIPLKNGYFYPPHNKNTVFIIDDMNLPRPEVFECAREKAHKGGWYDNQYASFSRYSLVSFTGCLTFDHHQ